MVPHCCYRDGICCRPRHDAKALHAPLPVALAQGKPSPFGSAYTFAIADTVVEGHGGDSHGSIEFLVFTSALSKLAAAAGLHPVRVGGQAGSPCTVSDCAGLKLQYS